MSKLSDKYASDSDSGDDALLGYVPFATPKKDLKPSAPVSDSLKKRGGEKTFSQDDVFDVEFLGVLPTVDNSHVADHIQRGEKVGSVSTNKPMTEVTMMEKVSWLSFAGRTTSSRGNLSNDSVVESDESDEWFERKKKPKVAGVKPEKKEIESKALVDSDESDEWFERKKKPKVAGAKREKKEIEIKTNASTIAAKKKLKGGEEKVKAKKKTGSEGKKKKMKDMSTEELLNTFEYPLPLGLGGKRLPCLRAFNAPLCKCRFMGTAVRMKVKPAKLPEVRAKVVFVRGVAKTFVQYGCPIPKDLGGGLRAYKCPGWTMSLNDRGGKVFGRKEGFSSGDNCKSLVIEEVKSCNVDDSGVYSITEVGLTDEAVEYFHSEGARISEKR